MTDDIAITMQVRLTLSGVGRGRTHETAMAAVARFARLVEIHYPSAEVLWHHTPVSIVSSGGMTMLDRKTRMAMHGWVAEVRFRVDGEDAPLVNGYASMGQALEALEHRRIDLHLDGGKRVIGGHVVDTEGNIVEHWGTSPEPPTPLEGPR